MYGKLSDGVLIFAPKNIEVDGTFYKPAPEHILITTGYKKIVYTDSPVTETDNHAEAVWIESETKIVQTWAIVEDSIETKCANRHLWLQETDYIGARIAEGSATAEYYADTIAKRNEWRTFIQQHENDENEVRNEF